MYRPAASLDLADDQRAPSGTDQVDLAVATAPVARQDGVAPGAVVRGGPLLTEAAECGVGIGPPFPMPNGRSDHCSVRA